MTHDEPAENAEPRRGGISASTALRLGLAGAVFILILLHIPLLGAEYSPRENLIYQLSELSRRVTGSPAYWIRDLFTPLLALVLLCTVGYPVWTLRRRQRGARVADRTPLRPAPGTSVRTTFTSSTGSTSTAKITSSTTSTTLLRTSATFGTSGDFSEPTRSTPDELHLEENQIRLMAHAGNLSWDAAMATPGGARVVLDLLAGMSPDSESPTATAPAAAETPADPVPVAPVAPRTAPAASPWSAEEAEPNLEEPDPEWDVRSSSPAPSRRPPAVYTPTSLYTSTTFSADEGDDETGAR